MKFIPKILYLLFTILTFSSCSEKSSAQTDPPVVLTDDEILTLAQKDAFKYFWDYAETNSKLARERYHVDEPFVDANLVTTGGSGFGLMTILSIS